MGSTTSSSRSAGQSFPPDAAMTVAQFLYPTQAKAAMLALRLGPEGYEAIYEALNQVNMERVDQACSSSSKPGETALAKRVEEAFQAARARGKSPRSLFWAVFKEMCEICACRPACLNYIHTSKCSECTASDRNRYSVRYFKGIETHLCCVCSQYFTTSDPLRERMAEMKRVEEVWRRRAYPGFSFNSLPPVLAALPFPTCPENFGLDFGGELVRRDEFIEAEKSFWELLRRSRDLRRQRSALVWLTLNYITPAEVEKGQKYCLFEDEIRVKQYLHLATIAVECTTLSRAYWHCIEPGKEEEFFDEEKLLVGLVKRATKLFHKIDRIGETLFSFGRLVPDRVLKRQHLMLDAVGLAYVGTPITDPSTHVPTRVLRSVKQKAMRMFETAPLFECEELAEELAKRLERDRASAHLASISRTPLVNTYFKGHTVGEVLLSDPAKAVYSIWEGARGEFVEFALEDDATKQFVMESRKKLKALLKEELDSMPKDDESDVSDLPLKRRLMRFRNNQKVIRKFFKGRKKAKRLAKQSAHFSAVRRKVLEAQAAGRHLPTIDDGPARVVSASAL